MVCTLLQKLRCHGNLRRCIETPMHAARYVSLMPTVQLSNMSSRDTWMSLHGIITQGSGNAAEHSLLLCSLLLGFGYDAYVCCGSIKTGAAHVWVMTREDDGIYVIESTTATKTLINADHHFSTVDSLFNDRVLYANIQPDNNVCEKHVIITL